MGVLEELNETMRAFSTEFIAQSMFMLMIDMPITFALFSKCGQESCGATRWIAFLMLGLPAAVIGGLVGAITYMLTNDVVYEVTLSIAVGIGALAVLYLTRGKILKKKAPIINKTLAVAAQAIG